MCGSARCGAWLGGRFKLLGMTSRRSGRCMEPGWCVGEALSRGKLMLPGLWCGSCGSVGEGSICGMLFCRRPLVCMALCGGGFGGMLSVDGF